MTIDGGLRKVFRDHLPDAQWTSIETGGTGLGVPDAEYCFLGGLQGWVEFKATTAVAVQIAPEQVAWMERRARLGGRIWLAVRQKAPRKALDAIFLYPGRVARGVLVNGLLTPPEGRWQGGPARWDWAAIRAVLTKP